MLTRVISGLAVAGAVGACLYFGKPYFHLLIGVFALIMLWEWLHVAFRAEPPAALLLPGGALLAGAVAVAGWGAPWWAAAAIAAGAILAIGAALARRPPQAAWLALGLVYVGAPALAMVALHDRAPEGPALILWVIAVVAATDIGAFFAGRSVGGPRLAPRLSPAKTWSGLAGGMLAAALVGALLGVYFLAASVAFGAIAGGLLAVVAQAGDLAESAFKRRFGVKDASGLIPGHGGLLDRVDGVVAAVVAVAVYVWANEGLTAPWK